MANFPGTSGNDTFNGTSLADTFDMVLGGKDTVFGNDGDDLFLFGASLDSTDTISGGAGFDTLSLDGDYGSPFTLLATMLRGVENVRLGGGHDYNLSLSSSAVITGSLSFDASALLAGDTFWLDTTLFAPTFSPVTIKVATGAGDSLIWSGVSDLLLKGGKGADHVNMWGFFSAGDNINGGGGIDWLDLNGNYAAGLTVTATMLRNVETLGLTGAFDYKFTFTDGVVAAGKTIFVDAVSITGALNFNGTQETDGSFQVVGGSGDDIIRGGAGNDVLDASSGVDHLYGMGGNDTLHVDSFLTSADRIDGGAGFDELGLTGDYSAGITITGVMAKNIEEIFMNPGNDYKITVTDDLTAAGQSMLIEAPTLSSANSLRFNGAAETDGNFHISAGEGDDSLRGGAGNDELWGANGSDILIGGAGSDTFDFLELADSHGTVRDTIKDFDAAQDFIHIGLLLAQPQAVDAAVSGQLDAATFFTGLQTALDAAHLGAHHAAIFTASGGTLAGRSYLIVDLDGTAGYQQAGDLLVEITGGNNLSSFGLSNFV